MTPKASLNKTQIFHFLAITISLLISGCGATSGERQDSSATTPQLAYVSRDLLFVIGQILPPRNTTIQLGKPRTAFGQELENGFREIGFGMQRVGADQGPSYLSYEETTRTTSGKRKTHTFSVYVGEIGLEREYVFVGQAVAPVSPLRVFGTTAEVKLNTELFPATADNSEITSVTYSKNTRTSAQTPDITLISEELIKDIVNTNNQQLPNYTSLNSQNILIENLYTKGSSNFEMANEDYRIVRKDIISFGDDSLRLRSRGKEQVKKLLTAFNSKTDKIRLIGCSNGPTSYKGGNEALALGRSKRVAQELIESGVDESAILDEGCWAPVSARDRFPARGVVIELRRKS